MKIYVISLSVSALFFGVIKVPYYVTGQGKPVDCNYETLLHDIQNWSLKYLKDINYLTAQIKSLMKSQSDKTMKMVAEYTEQLHLKLDGCENDGKDHKQKSCVDNVLKRLGNNVVLAEENVTLCLAAGYQEMHKLPAKIQPNLRTLENWKNSSSNNLRKCKSKMTDEGNCSKNNLDLMLRAFLYQMSPFPIVSSELAIYGIEEVSNVTICLKDIVKRLVYESIELLNDYNDCINGDMNALKDLLRYMSSC